MKRVSVCGIRHCHPDSFSLYDSHRHLWESDRVKREREPQVLMTEAFCCRLHQGRHRGQHRQPDNNSRVLTWSLVLFDEGIWRILSPKKRKNQQHFFLSQYFGAKTKQNKAKQVPQTHFLSTFFVSFASQGFVDNSV